MGNFNKVLSFILGLVVVIVFVIVLSKRLNLQSKFIPFGSKTSPTPTITKLSDKGLEKPTDKTKDTPEIKFTQPEEQEDTQETQEAVKQIQSIPETGPSEALLYLYTTIGTAGIFLRRFKK